MASRHTPRLIVIAVAALAVALGTLLALPTRTGPVVVDRAALVGESTVISRAGSVGTGAAGVSAAASPSASDSAAPSAAAVSSPSVAPTRPAPASAPSGKARRAVTSKKASTVTPGLGEVRSQGQARARGQRHLRGRGQAPRQCRRGDHWCVWSTPHGWSGSHHHKE